jgi:guanylate kinase
VSDGPLLVVLSGPSGAGKDSILNRLRQLGYPFHYTVTATTREPREGEVEGRDYYFLSTDDFQTLLARDGFLEHACVYGRLYGVPKSPVLDALERRQDVIMRTNVDGAESIRAQAPGAVLVFVTAPSIEALEQRLRQRQTDTAEEIERRLAKVHEEIARLQDFDYVVINGEDALDECVTSILGIITAEKCRVSRRPLGLK